MLYDLDAKARVYAQEAYLYLLDRFNLMLGDAMCALIVLDIVVGEHSWLGYAFAVIFVAFGAMIANWQRDKKYDRLNHAAEKNSEDFKLMRVVLICTNIALVLVLHNLAQVMIVIALFYLLTCKVRDRDPDRFKEEKPAPVQVRADN